MNGHTIKNKICVRCIQCRHLGQFIGNTKVKELSLCHLSTNKCDILVLGSGIAKMIHNSAITLVK